MARRLNPNLKFCLFSDTLLLGDRIEVLLKRDLNPERGNNVGQNLLFTEILVSIKRVGRPLVPPDLLKF